MYCLPEKRSGTPDQRGEVDQGKGWIRDHLWHERDLLAPPDACPAKSAPVPIWLSWTGEGVPEARCVAIAIEPRTSVPGFRGRTPTPADLATLFSPRTFTAHRRKTYR